MSNHDSVHDEGVSLAIFDPLRDALGASNPLGMFLGPCVFLPK